MTEQESDGEEKIGRIKRAFAALIFALAFGLVMTVVFGWPSFQSIAVLLMISGATLLFGGLLGFIFGIPRTLQDLNASTAQNKEEKTVISQVEFSITPILNRFLTGSQK
jgi:fatty acid desaturase